MRSFIIKPGDLIPIGRAGENQATEIRFDVTGWAETFGTGTFELIMQRPGDSELPYPVEVTVDGDYVVWTVSNVDTGIAGNCKVQLRYVVSDAVAKSVIYRGIVGESLDHAVDPPDPYDDLIERIEELARQTEQNAESASRSAGNASDSAAAAGRSATNAADSATQAGQSANGAAQSATDANEAKLAAQAAQQHAEAAQAGAEAAETHAMQVLPDVVTDWLDEHVDPETGYVIDDSFTIQNAAADSKSVGNAVITNVRDEYRFCQGGFSRAGSQLSYTYKGFYLIMGDYVQPNVYKVSTIDGYKVTCLAWNKSNLAYAGFLDDVNNFTKTTSHAVYFTTSIDFVALRKLYPDYLFLVELANNSTASGTNSTIYPSEGDAVIFSEIQGPDIRDYYEAEMAKTIDEAQAAITEPALVFPLATDIHFASESNLSTLFNVFIDNLHYLRERINCDFVANLGDNTDGDRGKSITTDRDKYMLRRFADPVDYLYSIGNHDTNYYAQGQGTSLALAEYFPNLLANTKRAHFDTLSDAPLNYYVDFDEIGVRVVQIDSSFGGRYTYSTKTAQWLTEEALVTNKTVLLLTHLSPISTQNWEGRQITNYSGVLTALRNFASSGTLIQMCGHSHADYYFSTPWLSVFNGCQKLEQADVTTSGFQAITGYQGSIISPARAKRTATEDLWSVCVLKPLSGELDVIRFGAGANRYFHYKATAVTTTKALTSVLTDTVTWTTSDATVATVSDGTVTAVGTGSCQITATDASGNFETWTVSVA